MQQVPSTPLTRDRIQALLDALDQSGGNFMEFAGLAGQARDAAGPAALAKLDLPFPAADMVRMGDDLGRLHLIWSLAEHDFDPASGGGAAAAHATFQTMGGRTPGEGPFAVITLDELTAVEAFAQRIGAVLSAGWDAALQQIGAAYDAERAAPRGTDDADPEARAWLAANGQEAPLASNRFDAEDARAFVEELYAAGAERVVIASECINDDAYELSLGGPYADGLRIHLPADPASRRALFQIANREIEDEGFDLVTDVGQDTIFLWWD